MRTETILSRLNSVRGSADRWLARCPAHDDKSPSLSIREGDRKLLLHCFAGCSVEAICAALQIKVSDLFSESAERRQPELAIVREAQRQVSALRSRLTPHDREREVTLVLASRDNPDPALARVLARAVEGDVVQVAFKEGR